MALCDCPSSSDPTSHGHRPLRVGRDMAVAGGWHLAPSPDEVVAKAVAAFKEIDPDCLIPMHCTGWNMIVAVQREMPQKLILPSSGTRVVFGAERA